MNLKISIVVVSLVIVLLALIAYSLLGDLSPPDQAIKMEIPYPAPADET